MKCDDCFVKEQVKNIKEPACCAWYLEHVVINGESVDKCPRYKKLDETERGENGFGSSGR